MHKNYFKELIVLDQSALINLLLTVNPNLTEEKAKAWVEAIWEDIEATRAKGGHKIVENHQTFQQVAQWIRSHGKHVHYLSDDPVAYIMLKGKKSNGPLH